MVNNELLKELSNKITAILPMATEVREDMEKRVQEVLQSGFSRLNLVTREEFDAQRKVLERAEQTIARLEGQIATLEEQQGISPATRDSETQ